MQLDNFTFPTYQSPNEIFNSFSNKEQLSFCEALLINGEVSSIHAGFTANHSNATREELVLLLQKDLTNL